MAKRSKLQRMHERRERSIEKELTMLNRLIEADDLIADAILYLEALPGDHKEMVHKLKQRYAK